ncbi:MAG: DUF6240 domain-containing protein [Cellulosilyticaceae bacterium]
MIKTVGNHPYERYEMSNVHKKEIEKNTQMRENSPKCKDLKEKQVYEQFLFQYKATDGEEFTTKGEWEKFVEKFSNKEEICGKLFASGYTLEDQTSQEFMYHTYAQESIKDQGNQVNQSVKQKIEKVQERNDSMYYYGVQHQGTITLNDLYKWSYSGGNAKSTKSYSKPQMQGILGMNGLDASQGNMQAVEKLLGLGLEVTPSHVTKIQNLETAVNGLEQYETDQKKLEETTPLLEDEKILYTDKDIQDIIDDLKKVDDQTIGQVIGEGKDVTIGNLRETLHKNTEKALGTQQHAKVSQESPVSPQDQPDMIKEQVKEIRAKLNVETAQKISEKMPLESTQLSEVAKALTETVEVQAEGGLKAAEVPITPENKAQVVQVIDAVVAMGRQKAIGIKMQHEDEAVTVEQVHQAVIAYEEQALEPEKRFGETIGRVEGQIEAFLETHDVTVTPEQIDAAKALILQELPLTKENLDAMKPVVLQMNTFLEEMTPARIASFIKEGMNPYEASIGSLMESLAAERLPKLKESLGEAIYALESKGKIDANQKQSLVGAYRILAGVEAHKFEVAGYLYKNQLPLTMARLEEALRYSQKEEHVAVQVDDTFGMLEEVKYTKKTARIMMEEAKDQQTHVVDYLKVLEQLQIPLENDEEVADYAQLSQRIYPFLKKELKTKLEGFKGIDTLPESFKEKMAVAKKVGPEVIQTLEKHQVPVTLNHIYWMQRLIDDPELYQKFLIAEQKEAKAFPKDLESHEKQMDEVYQEAKDAKETAMASGDLTNYKQHKQFEELITLQKQLMDKEGLYQIPFIIEGERKMVQLYIKENAHKKAEDPGRIKIAISYDTKRLGEVNAYLEITDQEMKYEVFGQNKKATQELRGQDHKLKALLEQIGYVLLEGNYQTDAKKATVVDPMPRRGDSEFEAMV